LPLARHELPESAAFDDERTLESRLDRRSGRCTDVGPGYNALDRLGLL
jgi:hypothetical protein